MFYLLVEAGYFLLRAFRLIPALLWWALAGLVFAGLNLALQDEVWPNTPAAAPAAELLALSCLPVAQWGMIITLERIRRTVRHTFWWACWSLAWLLSILAFAGLVLLCVFGGIEVLRQ
ncbi:hypothetical protein H8B15_06885 [Hymenobacter sp. BT507]|uniref:Uncharacterized protein n=1 Tax=Hymenobacter citatus TaxID=2763506 RepID=A0ABR7MHS4_9BACT|nr:hypothetical protein [Hymenobacter citatus]MBC6610640.1 hypothetical protein [Hymenobacter citatus]